ncbi:MAG: efflux RND transporter periplasmic adaptor subunit [Planctomycetota bacterium]
MRQYLVRQKWISAGIFGGVVCLAAVFFLATGGTRAADGDAEVVRALPVPVVAVKTEPGYRITRAYSGRIEARRASVLGFERSAEVVAVAVREGDEVGRGEVLARLDTRQLDTRKRQWTAEYDAARAMLDELVAGPRAEDIDVARAEVARRRALLERVKIRTARVENLHGRSAANDDELNEAVFELQASEAELAAADAQRRELENGTRPERLASQRARVAQLEALIAAVEVDLEDSVLKAPFAGTIRRRAVDEGSVVSAGQAVVELVEGGPREAWVGLPVEVASELAVGERSRLSLGDRELTGRVKAVLPTVDPRTRTVDAVFEFEASEMSDGAVPGRIVRLSLEDEVAESGFWLPTSALSRGTRGLWSAFVVSEAGRIERLDLEVLHPEAGRVYVRGAAVAGDLVVAEGVHRLAVGQSVVVSGDLREEVEGQAASPQPVRGGAAP